MPVEACNGIALPIIIIIIIIIIIPEQYKLQNSTRRISRLAEPVHKEIGRIVRNLVTI